MMQVYDGSLWIQFCQLISLKSFKPNDSAFFLPRLFSILHDNLMIRTCSLCKFTKFNLFTVVCLVLQGNNLVLIAMSEGARQRIASVIMNIRALRLLTHSRKQNYKKCEVTIIRLPQLNLFDRTTENRRDDKASAFSEHSRPSAKTRIAS